MNPFETIGGIIFFFILIGMISAICLHYQTGDREYLFYALGGAGIIFLLWLIGSGYWVFVVVIGFCGYVLKNYFPGFFEKKNPNAPQRGAANKGKSASNFRKKSGS